MPDVERLTGVAIQRGADLLQMVEGSHAQLRGWKDSEPADIEGFMTSTGRFVGRGVAQVIGLESGQVTVKGRQMLSSDVVWNAPKPKPVRTGKRWATPKKRF